MHARRGLSLYYRKDRQPGGISAKQRANVADDTDTTPPKGNGGTGGGRRSVDAKTRARIVRLARVGDKSRNAIAKECSVSPSTVTLVCRDATPPVTFDRSRTAVATEAREIDLKAKRSEISTKAVVEIERLFGLLTAEHEVFHWDTKTGFMTRDKIERPTSADVKNYATSIGILIDKHLVLLRADSDERDLPAVEQWLAVMMGSK